MKTSTIKWVAAQFNIPVYGYKCLNSPHDPLDWYDTRTGEFFTNTFNQLTCTTPTSKIKDTYTQLRLKSNACEAALIEFVDSFLPKQLSVASGHGLYIADYPWVRDRFSDTFISQCALLLARDGLQPCPERGSMFWDTPVGKRFAKRGPRAGDGK
jgi:hypothetical protein